ncbi:MAG: exodeoxyribonuclease VII large subunit [Christensenellaceae bacterium]|jgi:exodeoxyribonuclease VII large subunit|nr:exodeoxyribonuclease VII large subunit [Christensenellaceae bacterium]
MNERGITVTQLNNWVKQIFDAEEMLHNVEVIGDISGIKQSGRAVYFDLKDETASIPCVVWEPATKVMYADGKLLRDGEKVIVRGTVTYWNKAGKLNFNVTKCEKCGLSPLYLLFLQLQEKLKAEGLFDVAIKKSIPPEVKRIGVVTSKTGAVIHDIKNVVTRRNPSVDIVLIDTHVQGAGADIEIANAIKTFNALSLNIKTPDVLIVARGGGSAEDLATFNSELVARAVFASKIPIISAVGHESDHTLIDFVSDLRAPTPSVAAELCVREVLTQRDQAIQLYTSMRSGVLHKCDQATTDIDWRGLKNSVQKRYGEIEARIELLATLTEANNPLAILKKGFSKTDKDLNKLKSGDEFEILYYNKDIQKGVAVWKQHLPKSKS